MIQKMIQMFVQFDHNEELPVATGGHQARLGDFFYRTNRSDE